MDKINTRIKLARGVQAFMALKKETDVFVLLRYDEMLICSGPVANNKYTETRSLYVTSKRINNKNDLDILVEDTEFDGLFKKFKKQYNKDIKGVK